MSVTNAKNDVHSEWKKSTDDNEENIYILGTMDIWLWYCYFLLSNK